MGFWSRLFVCVFMGMVTLCKSDPLLLPLIKVQAPKPKYAPLAPFSYKINSSEPNDAPFLWENLEQIPGTFITQRGGPGQMTSFSFRGLGAQNTLVFLDGIPLNDAGSGQFDFAHVLRGNTGRVHIIPGADTVLYGPGASGGVILMESSNEIQDQLQVEGGSFQSAYAHAGKAVKSGKTFMRFEGEGFRTAGLPQYGKIRLSGERARYHNMTGSALLKTGGDKWNLKLTGRLIEAQSKYDAHTFNLPSKPQETQDTKIMLVGSELKLASSFVDHQVNLYLSQTTLENTGDFFSKSTLIGGRYNLNIPWTQNTSSLILLEVQQSTLKKEENFQKSIALSGIGVNQSFQLSPQWLLGIGGRLDHHTTFGTKATYNMSLAFKHALTTLKGSLRTGVKTPTLYELYVDNLYVQSNLKLRPELTRTIDVGIIQELPHQKGSFQLIQFWTQVQHMIQGEMNPRWVKINLGGTSHVSGTELKGELSPCETLTVGATYTYTQFALTQAGLSPDFPRQKRSMDITWKWDFQWKLKGQILYIGPRRSSNHPMPSYTLVQVGLDHKLSTTATLYGRIENLFDKRYQQIYGYQSPGRGIYAGASFKF